MKLNRTIAALAGASLAAFAASPAAAGDDDGLDFGDEGLTYTAADGQLELTLGGRAHLDLIHYDDEVTTDTFSEFRRARLELGVKIGDRLRLRVDREFTNGGGWRNVWAAFDVTDDLTLKGGNMIAPFSFEDLQSSNEMSFMERSLANALAPGYGVGGQVSYKADRWSVTGGWFGEAIDADEDGRPTDRGVGFTARGVFRPVDSRSQKVHLGLAVDSRSYGANDVTSLGSGPEIGFAPSLLRTGPITNVDTQMTIGAEAAWVRRNMMVQAQYIRSAYNRTAGGDFDVAGWYVQAGWALTGERYNYSDGQGVLRGLQPRRGRPALEVVARVSELDLVDGPIAGGVGRDYTLGANVYVTRNLRIMANYIRAEARDVAGRPDRDADILAARAMVAF